MVTDEGSRFHHRVVLCRTAASYTMAMMRRNVEMRFNEPILKAELWFSILRDKYEGEIEGPVIRSGKGGLMRSLLLDDH